MMPTAVETGAVKPIHPGGVIRGILQRTLPVRVHPPGEFVIRNTTTRLSRKSNVCLFEPLEDRRLLSASLSVAQSLMVFNAVRNSGNSYTETLALTDTGTSPLTLGSSGFTIANDPASSTQDA